MFAVNNNKLRGRGDDFVTRILALLEYTNKIYHGEGKRQAKERSKETKEGWKEEVMEKLVGENVPKC